MPTVLVNPSDRARRETASASSGFRMPAPSTELMVTPNSALSASHASFRSSTCRLFFETSSGRALSMLICR